MIVFLLTFSDLKFTGKKWFCLICSTRIRTRSQILKFIVKSVQHKHTVFTCLRLHASVPNEDIYLLHKPNLLESMQCRLVRYQIHTINWLQLDLSTPSSSLQHIFLLFVVYPVIDTANQPRRGAGYMHHSIGRSSVNNKKKKQQT